MEAELVALATSGATTLITLMISDAWMKAKERVAHILQRRGDGQGEVLHELENSRAALLRAIETGDGVRAAEIEEEWRDRLLHLLRSNPGLVADLQNVPAQPVGSVYNRISGRVRSGLVIQAGRIEGSTFHARAIERDDETGK